MDFRLTILGSSGAVPAWGRFPSAQALFVKDRVYLIDCGEGAQMRMQEHGIGSGRIRQIFISHLHGDHILGLMGLLQSMSLMGRSEPLTVFSPAGLRQMIEAFQSALSGKLLFELVFVELPVDRRQKVFEDHLVEVHAFPLKHHGMAVGYRFRERPRPRRMRSELIAQYDIPYTAIPAIKEGADWVAPDGRRIPNELLTEPPPPPRSYAYCCDTAWDPAVAEAVQGVDLLYHDATFAEAHVEQAERTQHSTARQAADIALRAGARDLILGHFSARYPDVGPLLAEARAVFPRCWAGLDGTTFSLAYRDKALTVSGPGRESVPSTG